MASFACGSRDQPGSLKVEEIIRNELVEVLDFYRAVGAWSDTGKLCGVVVWDEEPETWRIAALAVSFRFQRQGLAKQLKQFVLDCARDAGVKQVGSTVHGDNRPMVALNRAFGADMCADSSGEYVDCTITL